MSHGSAQRIRSPGHREPDPGGFQHQERDGRASGPAQPEAGQSGELLGYFARVQSTLRASLKGCKTVALGATPAMVSNITARSRSRFSA